MPLADDVSKNGFAVVRQLMSAAEIAKIREAAAAHFRSGGVPLLMGRSQPCAFHFCAELRWVLTHPRVLQVFREVIGDDPVFTLHSDLHSNIRSRWHRDTDGYFKFQDIADVDMQVYKMAIYLQEHRADGSGLSVKPGSHDKRATADNEAEIIAPELSVGDAIIFDVRLLHMGEPYSRADRALRLLPSNGTRSAASHLIRSVVGTRDKMSLFFTYGNAESWTAEFAKRNLERQIKQIGGALGAAQSELAVELRKHHVNMVAL